MASVITQPVALAGLAMLGGSARLAADRSCCRRRRCSPVGDTCRGTGLGFAAGRCWAPGLARTGQFCRFYRRLLRPIGRNGEAGATISAVTARLSARKVSRHDEDAVPQSSLLRGFRRRSRVSLPGQARSAVLLVPDLAGPGGRPGPGQQAGRCAGPRAAARRHPADGRRFRTGRCFTSARPRSIPISRSPRR